MLYIEAKERILLNMEKVNETFKKYFLQVMKRLSIDHQTDEIKTYRVYYTEGDDYFGIDLESVQFKASNRYELWLNIHHYVIEYGEEIYHDKLYYQYTIDEAFTQEFEKQFDEDAAMIKTIEFELDSWENGDILYWEEV